MRDLLATTSIVALACAAGQPARACTAYALTPSVNTPGSFTIPGNFSCVTVTANTVSIGGALINSGTIGTPATGAAINLNQGTFGSVVNTGSGTITSTGTVALLFGATSSANSAVTVTGGITNAGTIAASSATALMISGTPSKGSHSFASISGGINNTGLISGATNAIFIGAFGGGFSTFSGGVTNSGTLSAAQVILVAGVSTFSGGIANNGLIQDQNGPTTGTGIAVSGVSSFSGGIANNAGGTIIGDLEGILVTGVSTFAGGISNAGSIVGDRGIQVGTSEAGQVTSFTGGIVNTGTIAAGSTGIAISGVSTFGGGIANGGLIAATAGGGVVVGDVSLFSGGIGNTGTIQGGSITFFGEDSPPSIFPGAGVKVSGVSTFLGGIANAGQLSSVSSGAIVLANVSSFGGGIANAGFISGIGGGIVVGTSSGGGVSTFSGGIVNGGVISATGTGIIARNSLTFSGGITNSGSIVGGFTGIAVLGVRTFIGDVVNTGTLSSSGTGIRLGSAFETGISTFAGGITNSGTISAGSTGIFVRGVTVFTGSISNSGTIAAGSVGIRVTGTQFAPISVFSGGVANSGTIQAPGGILLAGIQTLAGGVTNSGVISATTAIRLIDVTSFAGGITNSGTITAQANGLLVTSVSTFTGGITNSGTISSGGNGILVPAVASFVGGVTNTGTISAGAGIVFVNTPSVSVFDSGSITGSGGTAVRFSGGVNTLTLGPGFSLSGSVVGAGQDVLQLGGTGTGVFDLGSIGVQYTGFSRFAVSGANWVATGTNGNDWSVSPGATLQLGDGVTTGSITGAIADGGTLAVANPGTYTLAGPITGGGGFVQLGPGTTVLSAANSYSGGTTISGGTLQATGNQSIGSGPLTLNGGTFQAGAANLAFANPVVLNAAGGTVDTQANTLTLSGNITNGNGTTGALGKTGSGTLILSGNNTYSGPTNVAAGVLQAGSPGGFSPNSAFTVAPGAMLSFGSFAASLGSLSGGGSVVIGSGGLTVGTDNSSTRFAGVLSGTGGLTKVGGGFLELSGANTYSGGTTILAGTLVGTTTSLQGNILDNAALVFDQAAGGTFAGALSGGGTLTIHGAGTVVFTGDSGGFTGETRLAGGALQVGTLTTPGARLGGTVDVLAGGVLSGHGTVGTLNNVGGVVMPGGSVGTLTVNGNYTQGAGGMLVVEVTPTAASQLKVNGTATLGGTLMLAYDPGTYSPATYTFVSAPSVTGAFSQITTSGTPSGLSQGLNFDPATGQLVLGGAGGFVVAPTNDTIFPAMSSALVQNAQQATSIVLDRLAARLGVGGDNPALASLVAAPGLQLAELGGSNLAALQGVATALPAAVADAGGWFRGLGSFGTVNGNGNGNIAAPGFDTASGGFLAGFDKPVGPGLFAGLAAGYTHADVAEHATSSGAADTGRIILYGGGLLGPAVWSAAAGYAHDSVGTQRPFAGIGTAHAGYGANEFTFGGQGSVPFAVAGATVAPRAGVRLVHLGNDGFTETGAGGVDLSGQPNGTTSVQPFVGATAFRTLVTGDGLEVTPQLQLGYAREVAGDGRTIRVASADGTPFTVEGLRPSRDILTTGAGLTVRAGDNLYLYADYAADLPVGNTLNQTFSLGLRLLFAPAAAGTASTEPAPADEAEDGDRDRLLARQQQLFERTLHDPGNLDVIYRYAAVSAHLGDNEAAIEALERMLLFNPNLPTVDLELGVLYYRLGSFEAAQAYLEKARALNPSPEVLARIDAYAAKIADAQQTTGLSGTLSLGTQYQTDANVAPGSPLIHAPIGDVMLSNPFVKHDDTNLFATGALLYTYDLGTQDGDAIELAGTGFANHYFVFDRLDLDLGELTAGPRLRYPNLDLGPVRSATLKPYAILNEVGLGERQYFWTYGAGAEATAVLGDDLAVKATYEFRDKNFTNAPDRPLSRGLNGNDNLVTLALTKPVTLNSQLSAEFDYLDQSTRLAYYTNQTYALAAAYRVRYPDPSGLINQPWETTFFASRSWSIYAAPDPCCNTSGTPTFSPSARNDRHWRLGLTQTFPLTPQTAIIAQLQRDILASNIPLYAYSSNSATLALRIRF